MRHDTALPPSLSRPRPISSWNDVPLRFGTTFALVGASANALEAAARSAGLPGAYIARGRGIPAAVGRYLPQILRSGAVPILGDLIPETSWGSSLANLLTKRCWDGLRLAHFAAVGGACEMCGARDPLQGHELWSYFEPQATAPIAEGCMRFGVQRLERLIAVCEACHATHHLGKAGLDGRLDEALERLAGINRWDDRDVEEYYAFVAERWKRRSDFGWILDVRAVVPTIAHDADDDPEPLVVSRSWKMDDDDPRFLTRERQYGVSRTALVESAWCYVDQRDVVRYGVPAEEAYSED